LAKERMPTVQVLLDKMSLRYCQVMWLGPEAETLEQVLSVLCISNSEKSIQEQVAWLRISFRTKRSIEQLAVVL